MSASRGALAAALLLDALVDEPPTALHPVGWMGQLIAAGRKARTTREPLPALLQGAVLLGGGAAAVAAAACLARAGVRRLPRGLRAAAEGAALKPALALRALLGAGAEIEQALVRGEVPEARRLLAWHLVSRDTSGLSVAEVAGAAIESVAENLGDGFVAPVLAYRFGGLPAAYVYRWVNTCDAMIGYRTDELEWFGKTAARADDVLNWLPARVSALAIAGAAGLHGADAAGALRCAAGDALRTSSPNAGWPMAAMAGALGVRLTKRGVYALNDAGREPTAADLRRALRLARTAGALAGTAAVLMPAS
jgi:adenosylcobinamide-phosphate synthase